MAEYSLDVVFNSATQPVKPDGRIYAMGFGFAESPSGTGRRMASRWSVCATGHSLLQHLRHRA